MNPAALNRQIAGKSDPALYWLIHALNCAVTLSCLAVMLILTPLFILIHRRNPFSSNSTHN